MKLLTMADLKPAKGIGYSRVHIYRLIAAGNFPKPISLSANRVAFIESGIDDWLIARVAERDEEAA